MKCKHTKIFTNRRCCDECSCNVQGRGPKIHKQELKFYCQSRRKTYKHESGKNEDHRNRSEGRTTHGYILGLKGPVAGRRGTVGRTTHTEVV